jgi:hypothetical protein
MSFKEFRILFLIMMLGTIIPNMWAQYCTGGPNATSDTNVLNVTLSGDTTTIDYTSTGGVTGLEDLTHLVADLIPGESYSVSVTWGTHGGSYSSAGSIWIDWDISESFEESELVGDWSGTPTVTESYNFTVPMTAEIGDSRMRVSMQEGGWLPLNPCATFAYGSMMDFGISVAPGEAEFDDDMAAISIEGSVFPTINVPSVYTIRVRNMGDNIQDNYTVKLMLEGGILLDSEIVNISLDFLDETEIELEWTPTNEGSTYIYGEVELIGDENLDNNTTDNLELLVLGESLAGVYEIDQSGNGDYISFTEALDYMSLVGISAPVTFEVAPGIYDEQLVISEVSGTSEDNMITFIGVNDERESSTLRYSPSMSTERYVVLLDGAKNVRFENLTIEATEGANYGWVFLMRNGSDNIELINNMINTNMPITSTVQSYGAIIASNSYTSYTGQGNNVNNLLIEDNTILGGHSGINIYGANSSYLTDIQILNNDILGAYSWGVNLWYVSNPMVKYNNVSTRTDGTVGTGGGGITVYNADDVVEVSYNRITNVGSNGLMLANINTPPGEQSLIANNSIGGGFRRTSTDCYGINMGNVTNVGIYYNSINMDGDAGRAIYLSGFSASGIYLLNNSFVFSGSSDGYAAYILYPATISVIDFNNYFAGDSNNFVYYGSAKADLAQLQAVEVPAGNDDNSLSGNPYYRSTFDLYPFDSLLYGEGISYAIFDDIDGTERDPDNPCIGCYEFELPDTPIIAVFPEEHDYGNEHIFLESVPQEFIIQNQGIGLLTISSISLTGDDSDQFELDDNNIYDIVLEATETAIVEVTFSPTTEGSKNASLTIVDDLGRAVTHIPITGYAEDYTIYTYPWFVGFEDQNVDGSAVYGFFQEAESGTSQWFANNSQTTYNRSPKSGDWNATLYRNNTHWLFKPMELEENVSYYFKMYARQDGTNQLNASLTVMYGDEPSVSAMDEDIITETNLLNGDYQEISGVFFSQASGLFYLGIRGYIGFAWYLSIDDLSLEKRGTLQGTVVDSEVSEPVSGVLVEVVGTPYSAVTDSFGFYRIPGLETGSYDVSITKLGYYDQTIENVEIIQPQITTQNFEIISEPTYTVSGFNNSNDLPEGLSGANIYLNGVINYQLLDAPAEWAIDNVLYYQQYTLIIESEGYETYIEEIGVGAADLDLGTITLFEITEPVYVVTAEMIDDDSQVELTWQTFPSDYFFDFEDGDQGWSTGTISGNNQWELGSPAQTNINSAHSGDTAWMTKLSQNYEANANCWLVSPELDLSIYDEVEFSVWLNIYCQTAYDAMILESSVDGGSTWQKVVGDDGFYNNNHSFGSVSPPKWSGFVGSWNQYTTSLQSLSGESSVYFRFRFVSSGWYGNSHDGIAIDDVYIGSPENRLLRQIADNRAFLGYNVYRFIEGQEDDINLWEQLNTTTVIDTTFIDEDWLSLEYGESYQWAVNSVYDGGLLSEPSFSNTLLFLPELYPPVVSIEIMGGEVMLNWDSVPGAVSYFIYSSENPYSEEWDLIDQVAEPSFSESVDNVKFYKVSASSDSLPAVLGVPQNLENILQK